MPVTMTRLNLVKGLGPVLQIAEGWTVEIDPEVHKLLDERTDRTWPTTWFVPRLCDKPAFEDVYSVMNNWGANHGAISYGHIGQDLITLASMLRIPVCMHNVDEKKIFRPAAWNAFGMDKEGADYRACTTYGPIYKYQIEIDMITNEHIEQFIAQAHRVGDAGLTICSSGNISWRIGDEVLLSGTGSWVPSLPKEKVAVCRLSTGEVLNGVKPSMESGFHLGVLRERPDVNVVLHFQSHYATAVACMKNRPTNFNVTAEIPCHVGSEIPVVPYYRPGSKELAQGVIDALKDHNSVLLLKHGQVVCGKDFDQAFERAMFFEMACRIMIQSGGDYTVLTPEEIDDLETYILGKKTK